MLFRYFENANQVLGMNSRNLEFIRPCNLKKARRIADNKLVSKRVLSKAGLPVPKLLAKITTFEELENFDWNALPTSFALKPASGFGGEGIIVVYGKTKSGDNWIKADGSKVTTEDIKTHIRNILDGSFSLSNTPDIAFFEERLTLLKLFKPYTFKGIPDIRVIVYNKVPVMAMLRIPTKESGGRANLTQGAVGTGIDMATGTTTTAVAGKGKVVDYAPGTRMLLSGIKIPYWSDILHMAVRAQEISGLGFLGADIAIDKEKGPVFVELNARAGLSIQVANMTGLKERLRRVQGLKIKTIERGVRVGMDLFGGEIEEELEDISGKKIIGTVEKVKLIGKDGKEIEVEAKIDTGASSTSIDLELAEKLGFGETLAYFKKIEKPMSFSRDQVKQVENDLRNKYLAGHPDLKDISIVYSPSGVTIRPEVEIRFVMDDIAVLSKTNIIERTSLKYPMIIGKKDLRKFLIEVNK